MIPRWADVLAGAAARLAPGGALHVVDFGAGSGLAAPLRRARDNWLALFDVVPRAALADTVAALAMAERLACSTTELYRGYAVYAVLRRPIG